jgi:hypothetical protein
MANGFFFINFQEMDKDKHKELRRNIGNIVINRIKRYNEQILFLSSRSWIWRNTDFIFMLLFALLVDLFLLLVFTIEYHPIPITWNPWCSILALIFYGYFSSYNSRILLVKGNIRSDPELTAVNKFNCFYRNEIDLADFLNRKPSLINGLMEKYTFDLKVTELHSRVIENIINDCCENLRFVQPYNLSREDRMRILTKRILKSNSTKVDMIESISSLRDNLYKLTKFEVIRKTFYSFILPSDHYDIVMKEYNKDFYHVASIAHDAIEKLKQESECEK